MEVQAAIGADIAMVLDVCLDSTSDDVAMHAAMERTHRWAVRCLAARQSDRQALFAIVQGGVVAGLRRESAAFLTAHAFDGFAIGGLAVGDTRGDREQITAMATELLPADRPRYLMAWARRPICCRRCSRESTCSTASCRRTSRGRARRSPPRGA